MRSVILMAAVLSCFGLIGQTVKVHTKGRWGTLVELETKKYYLQAAKAQGKKVDLTVFKSCSCQGKQTQFTYFNLSPTDGELYEFPVSLQRSFLIITDTSFFNMPTPKVNQFLGKTLTTVQRKELLKLASKGVKRNGHLVVVISKSGYQISSLQELVKSFDKKYIAFKKSCEAKCTTN